MTNANGHCLKDGVRAAKKPPATQSKRRGKNGGGICMRGVDSKRRVCPTKNSQNAIRPIGERGKDG